MKDIDKMSSNELRAEVRVLRAVCEAAKWFVAEFDEDWDKERMSIDTRGAANKTRKAIAAVEAQEVVCQHDWQIKDERFGSDVLPDIYVWKCRKPECGVIQNTLTGEPPIATVYSEDI